MKIDTRNRFTLRLAKDLFDEIDTEAKSMGVSKNALILMILKDWTEEQRKKE